LAECFEAPVYGRVVDVARRRDAEEPTEAFPHGLGLVQRVGVVVHLRPVVGRAEEHTKHLL
jgi:hypothetical protein